ncbi:hypothetical protein N183_36220 [Sinorhizobium sp. Sb3]|nr:hypothetical protein N183_36220 [Sinorhizobium sp. Sb3]
MLATFGAVHDDAAPGKFYAQLMLHSTFGQPLGRRIVMCSLPSLVAPDPVARFQDYQVVDGAPGH